MVKRFGPYGVQKTSRAPRLGDPVLSDSIVLNLVSIATCRLPIHADSIVLPAGPTKWKKR